MELRVHGYAARCTSSPAPQALYTTPSSHGMRWLSSLNATDLADLTERAFGTQYQRCKRVTIGSNCRLARLFFQDREYEDVELPSFLRVIK